MQWGQPSWALGVASRTLVLQTARHGSPGDFSVFTTADPPVRAAAGAYHYFPPAKGQRLVAAGYVPELCRQADPVHRRPRVIQPPGTQNLTETCPSLAHSWHLEMKETRSCSQSMSVCHMRRQQPCGPVCPPTQDARVSLKGLCWGETPIQFGASSQRWKEVGSFSNETNSRAPHVPKASRPPGEAVMGSKAKAERGRPRTPDHSHDLGGDPLVCCGTRDRNAVERRAQPRGAAFPLPEGQTKAARWTHGLRLWVWAQLSWDSEYQQVWGPGAEGLRTRPASVTSFERRRTRCLPRELRPLGKVPLSSLLWTKGRQPRPRPTLAGPSPPSSMGLV